MNSSAHVDVALLWRGYEPAGLGHALVRSPLARVMRTQAATEDKQRVSVRLSKLPSLPTSLHIVRGHLANTNRESEQWKWRKRLNTEQQFFGWFSQRD